MSFYFSVAPCLFCSASLFSSTDRIYIMMNHILDHKTHITKYKIKIIHIHVVSDHSRIKQEVNNRKITRKMPAIWKQNNALLSNHGPKRKSQQKSKTTLDWMKMAIKHQMYGTQQMQCWDENMNMINAYIIKKGKIWNKQSRLLLQ